MKSKNPQNKLLYIKDRLGGLQRPGECQVGEMDLKVFQLTNNQIQENVNYIGMTKVQNQPFVAYLKSTCGIFEIS